jgi:hypothetical protein
MSIATLLSNFKVRRLAPDSKSQSLGGSELIMQADKERRWPSNRCANEVWRVAA